MKNRKKLATIYYLCSIAFFVMALIWSLLRPERSIGFACMALGFVWMSLGTVQLSKAKKEDNTSDKDNTAVKNDIDETK